MPEEGPSFRVEMTCAIKRLLGEGEPCCWTITTFRLLCLANVVFELLGDWFPPDVFSSLGQDIPPPDPPGVGFTDSTYNTVSGVARPYKYPSSQGHSSSQKRKVLSLPPGKFEDKEEEEEDYTPMVSLKNFLINLNVSWLDQNENRWFSFLPSCENCRLNWLNV